VIKPILDRGLRYVAEFAVAGGGTDDTSDA